jgi:hypothetical protein
MGFRFVAAAFTTLMAFVTVPTRQRFRKVSS